MNTKERIIEKSINLFSINGYDSVSIRDIAKNVGIKGSSIYNHFQNKREIYNCVITTYSDHVSYSLKKIQNYWNKNLSSDNNLSGDLFVTQQMQTFKFLLTNTECVKLRKTLLIDKFKNKKASLLFEKLYINDILNYQKNILEKIIKTEYLVNKDMYTLALQLYSPVFLLFYKDPDEINDNDYNALTTHLMNFKKYYCIGD